MGDKIKPLNEHGNCVTLFDDLLGSPNSKNQDQFFIIERYHNLDILSMPIPFSFAKKNNKKV